MVSDNAKTGQLQPVNRGTNQLIFVARSVLGMITRQINEVEPGHEIPIKPVNDAHKVRIILMTSRGQVQVANVRPGKHAGGI